MVCGGYGYALGKSDNIPFLPRRQRNTVPFNTIVIWIIYGRRLLQVVETENDKNEKRNTTSVKKSIQQLTDP